MGRAIAVTTYAGLFNINPRIDSPQVIIFDDAHSCENYISKMWSLTISRNEHKKIYEQVVALIRSELPSHFASRLYEEDVPPEHRSKVELISSPCLAHKLNALSDLLDANADSDNKLSFPWHLIRGKINVCSLFISWGEILIRPWISPTLTHAPFACANQRLYMSATLGTGGDLERIIGVPKIARIPVPSGWDKQGTGRRLFLFPEVSFSPREYQPWLANYLSTQDRSLVLTPNRVALSSFEEVITQRSLQTPVLYAHDIESTIEPFIKSKSILALTNRYDGIDLPGEMCRSLIMYQIPTAVNLQERFLWSNLRQTAVLGDRIRTRITQAVGRCTRNSTDYATVIMIGDDLVDFCIKKENREQLHPELRAEMEFGIDNSEAEEFEHYDTIINLFMNRSAEWEEAEADITQRRNDALLPERSFVAKLAVAAEEEVKCQYDLWNGNYEGALVKATKISEMLSGDELAGYRALWYYFSGCCAFCIAAEENKKEMLDMAKQYFSRASQASGYSWFVKLKAGIKEQGEVEPIEPSSIFAAEAINDYIVKMGFHGTKFDRRIANYHEYVKNTDANKFDQGLTELGAMLGFEANRPVGNGTPDSIWMLGDEVVVVFECKSEETPQDNISISTCRQAQGHKAWLQANVQIRKETSIITIVASPREYLDKDAIPHAKELYYMSTKDVEVLFEEAEELLRNIRSLSSGIETQARILLIQEALNKAVLSPSQLLKRLISHPLSDIKQR